ncbi:Diaminopimelate epimerase [Rubellimicrobium mesophilum DSM 19309]|uniref:Diaminopimelate epimerase n=2 Tax=Rubellimicrobium TaxID=295418 RepID=A0A017HLV7_9RHOB|nr:Diaminopimelate epimerase [Rubellimicrobium mesophilum DSM 19309]
MAAARRGQGPLAPRFDQDYVGAMRDRTDTGLPFQKMHGLGNDFVVIDGRGTGLSVTPALARRLGDRHRGVGFDQLALIEDAPGADLALRFWNADGSESSTCGNATRCIARAEMDRTGKARLAIRTERGLLAAKDEGDGITSVNMGPPRLLWHEIPLAQEMDTLELPIEGAPTATSMGNPHCTFFVPDAEVVDLLAFGPAHEHHPLFPQRTNVQVVQVLAPDRLRMRVWERGTGLTLASGSSSCAVTVAAARRGLTGRDVTVVLDGGELRVRWAEDGVWMTGRTAHVFSGVLTPAFLEALA